MANIDPQQELFIALKLGIEALGYTVYDGVMPPDGTPYPFVYLGDFQQQDTDTKGFVIGKVSPAIHVWSDNPRNRGTVSQMLLDIKRVCRGITQTTNFSWCVRNINQHILPDNTTKTPLLHGVINADFSFV